ncbi:MAG TPA: hypothetical protein VI248_25055 [Kineosporiaceae bacterium]
MTPPRWTIRAEIGSLGVDVPLDLGFYGGLAAAVAFGALDPPLAVAAAVVPVLSQFDERSVPGPARLPIRLAGQLLRNLATAAFGPEGPRPAYRPGEREQAGVTLARVAVVPARASGDRGSRR